MSTPELLLAVVALLAVGAALLGWHYAIVNREDFRELLDRLPGCCGRCGGSGVDGDPGTGGLCWDCQGTGHPHVGVCAMPWRERVQLEHARQFWMRRT